MKAQIIGDHFNKSIYNGAATHPLQSWEWGEARRKMGIDVLRIGEFDSSSLKNIFQVTFHSVPYTNFTVGYLPRSVIPSERVLDVLKQEGRRRNAVFIKIEPYIMKSQDSERPQITHYQLPITKSNHPLFPKWTIQLDVAKSEEQLMKNMKSKTRYNIRLAKKKGVVVREMTSKEAFDIFAKLYFETCRRQKYYGHNYKYHKTIFETLKNKISHILIAYYKNTPLSVYEIFIFNDVLYYPYGGSSIEHRNLMASNLLMWEVIRFGKKRGCKVFDMWGSLSPSYDRSAKWAGFTRFKEGFGGEFVELVGSYDLVLNHLLYNVYNIIYQLRTTILSWKI